MEFRARACSAASFLHAACALALRGQLLRAQNAHALHGMVDHRPQRVHIHVGVLVDPGRSGRSVTGQWELGAGVRALPAELVLFPAKGRVGMQGVAPAFGWAVCTAMAVSQATALAPHALDSTCSDRQSRQQNTHINNLLDRLRKVQLAEEGVLRVGVEPLKVGALLGAHHLPARDFTTWNSGQGEARKVCRARRQGPGGVLRARCSSLNCVERFPEAQQPLAKHRPPADAGPSGQRLSCLPAHLSGPHL